MKDMSGVKWGAVPVVGGYGPLIGRQDEVSTPDSWSPTPSNITEEVPDGGSEPPG